MKTETNATTHIRVGFGSQKGASGKVPLPKYLQAFSTMRRISNC